MSARKLWLDLVRDEQEFYRLRQLLHTVPDYWLEQTEELVVRRGRRPPSIRDPLEYRVGTLWAAIVSLQETKFITDQVELTLRRALVDQCARERIPVSAIFYSFENCKSDLAHVASRSAAIDVTVESLTEEAASWLNFSQLVSIYRNNWTRIAYKHVTWKGLGTILHRHVGLGRSSKDVTVFKADMDFLRTTRNTLAHSKALLSREQVQRVHVVAALWLAAAGVDLEKRIVAYRTRRPRFLENFSGRLPAPRTVR